MRIKSFKGRTTAEALHQVRTQMGDRALILQSRTLRDRGLLGRLKKTGVEIVAAMDDAAPAAPPEPARPAALDELRARLVKHGIEPTFADELVEDVARLSGGQPLREPGRLSAALAAALGEKLATTGGLRTWAGGRRVIAFVGPTGVGKTTTIAKLAAELTLIARRRVELITIDAHRIGAVDQLKAYAELIGIPVHAAYTPEEFAAAVARASKAEFVLVDTPGCSHRDGAALVELEQHFRLVPGLEVNVLVSCAWKVDDAVSAVTAFRPVAGSRADNREGNEPVQLIFTKLDETSTYGSLVTVARRSRLPVSYVCDGQEVPDDIAEAAPELIAGLLVGGATPSRGAIR